MVTGYTYNTLTAALGVYIATDTALDLDLPGALPTIIENAELRCMRDVDFLVTRKVDMSQTFGATGTPADALLTMPADMVIMRELGYFTPVGSDEDTGEYVDLDRVSESFLQVYWPNRQLTAAVGMQAVKYYTEPTFGQLRFAPTPDAPYRVRQAYTYRLAGLTLANQSNWISLNVPDLLFAACMCEATGYQQNFGAQADDPKMAVSWERVYERLKGQATLDEARRKSANYANASASQPPALIPATLQ